MFLKLKNANKPGKQQSELPDEILVAHYLQSRNKDLIAVLFDRYTHLVYGICLQYFKDKDQCKDAVMEIFESLFEKLASHHVSSFKNWLFTVSRNHCLMAMRKAASYDRSVKKSILHSDLQQQEPFEVNPQETAARNESLIQTAMESLNEEQRLCVTLMYLQEKSYKDITRLTGYPMNLVKSHIQNGKRNMKNYLLSRYDFFFP